jgi:hypothetical protein
MRGFPSPGELRVTGMPARLRLAPLFALAIVAIALLAVPTYAPGQQTDLSQQMQLFNSLTPDQQQAILQRLGGGGGLGGSSLGGSSLGGTGLGGSGLGGLGGLGTGSSLLGGGITNRSQSALLQQMQLQQQRRFNEQLQENPEFPVFKPGDTVLVEVSLLAEKPANNGNQNNQNNQNATPDQNAPSSNPNPNAINSGLLSSSQRSLLGLDNGMNGQRLQEQPQRTIEELQAEEKRQLEDMIEQIRAVAGHPRHGTGGTERRSRDPPRFRRAGVREAVHQTHAPAAR